MLKKVLSPVVLAAALLALASCITFAARADLGTGPQFRLNDATFAATGDGGLTVHGKIYVRYRVAGFTVTCKVLDATRAYTPATVQVLPSCKTDPANCPTRPLLDALEYTKCLNDPAVTDKTKCPMKEIGRVPNFTQCEPAVIKAPSYRPVTANGRTGMALCALVPGESRLHALGWSDADEYERKYFPEAKALFTDLDGKICDALTSWLDAPAPLPPPPPTGVTTTGANDYTFYCKSDDGCRVWVNNVIVIDNWKQQSPLEVSGTITLAPGKYPLKVEYFDASGGAEVHLAYSSGAIAKQIVPAGKLSNLAGLYFNFENFTGEATQRLDSNIDFNWGTGAPLDSVGADHFSVRWLGDITVP